ncbi:MAG: hypothetical protein SGILL_003747 [Bacillariaceae sp.]
MAKVGRGFFKGTRPSNTNAARKSDIDPSLGEMAYEVFMQNWYLDGDLIKIISDATKQLEELEFRRSFERMTMRVEEMRIRRNEHPKPATSQLDRWKPVYDPKSNDHWTNSARLEFLGYQHLIEECKKGVQGNKSSSIKTDASNQSSGGEICIRMPIDMEAERSGTTAENLYLYPRPSRGEYGWLDPTPDFIGRKPEKVAKKALKWPFDAWTLDEELALAKQKTSVK